ncbi:MAG: START domain-containing protein [Ferruginibacter sp.]
MKSIIYYLFFFFMLHASTLYAQKDWAISKDKGNIKVYTKSGVNSKFKSVKVTCTTPGTIDQLIATFKNVEANMFWVYSCKKSYMIKTVDADNIIYYVESGAPWPVSNRDVIVNMNFKKSADNKNLTVTTSDNKTILQPKKGIVRVSSLSANWHIAALDDKNIMITYYLDVNPGGSVPAWAYNLFIADGPYSTFDKLTSLLKNK